MMRKILNNILWVLPMLLSLSCSHEVEDSDVMALEDKTFAISATKGADETTSTTIDDGYEHFDDGDAIRVGLFRYSDGGASLEKYSDLLVTDIYAKYVVGDAPHWTYGYGREGDAENVAYKVIKTDGTKPILAACYPYRDARDLKHIPFSLSDKQGLMWSKPVEVTDENKNTIPLKFHHSMAKINIKVEFKYEITSSDNYYPKCPTLFDLKVIGDTELVGSANYDSTTGKFSDKKMIDSVSLMTYSNIPNRYGTYKIVDNEKYYDVTIYLVPELEFDGIDIRLSWQGGTYYGKFYPYHLLDGLTIDNDRIQIGTLTGTETTLKAGYEYTYNITVNNYLKFSGITIDTDWIEESTPLTGNI